MSSFSFLAQLPSLLIQPRVADAGQTLQFAALVSGASVGDYFGNNVMTPDQSLAVNLKGASGNAVIGTPNALSPTFGTAYQATDPTKPSLISAMIETVYSITVGNTQSDTVELRIGPVQATVANGSAGTAVATYKNSLTGITLSIGMGTINRNQLSAILPTGWYYALRRVVGSIATITSATDQSLG